MASDTKNVKLGVCKAFFDGIDLGYTKGGVEVQVTTETHRVEVDQFGKTPVNESILGRDVKVKVPMAETTLRNMVRIMPGASLVETGAVAASGTVTLPGTVPADGQTILINGKAAVAKTASPNAANGEYLIGADVDVTGANLAAMLNASTHPEWAVASYSYSAGTNIMTVTYGDKGIEGNSFTLAVGTYAAVTVSGATLAGGVAATAMRVDVTDGVGTDLLSIAKELRLHPKAKADSDRSEDFVVPLAATPGALTFAYKLDDERIYNVEFMGYPDVANGGKLFSVGDPAAI
jgi:hypothetical protein